MQGVSGHADQAGLLRWLDAFQTPPRRIFVVHGESSVCEEFAGIVARRYNVPVSAPDYMARFDLVSNTMLDPGVKREAMKPKPAVSAAVPAGVFGRLVAAGKRLMQIIERSKGRANKDLTKFTNQINALCDKWE